MLTGFGSLDLPRWTHTCISGEEGAPGRPGREIVVTYGVTGSPARGERTDAQYVPVLSTDGLVLLYGSGIAPSEDRYYALQATTLITDAPPWATLVGQPYRITSNAADLSGASINFSYLQRDVPATEEPGLEIYYYDEQQGTWELRSTAEDEVDTVHNATAAPISRPGLYALMSTVKLPLKAGWNSFAYESTLTRPITDALASIVGTYEVVLAYDESAPQGPWLVYDPDNPGSSTLDLLQPQRGYLIFVTRDLTLRLRGGNAVNGASVVSTPQAAPPTLPPAPAYFAGPVEAGPGMVPAAGMEVVALIGGARCGHGSTYARGEQIVYGVVVSSDGPNAPGCGAFGRTVTFRIGGVDLATRAAWSNDYPHELPLGEERSAP